MTDPRTALVTGAGSELGKAICRALAASGVTLILTGRTVSVLHDLAIEISDGGGQIAAVATCDVSDRRQVEALRNELQEHDISILVNNAGIGGPVGDLVDLDPDDWRQVFDTNVYGTLLMCRAFLPPMIARRGGDVINIASVTGKRPLAGRTPYAASKMALLGLTTTLAAEVGPANVNVNTLSPGPVRGERMRRNFELEAKRLGISPKEAERAFVQRAAFNRLLLSEEVGDAVVAMLQMSGMTGADIDLSAGMFAR